MSRFAGVGHALLYSKYRPLPPKELISWVVDHIVNMGTKLNKAVDVGCGGGQSTGALSPYFKNVTGIDVSEAQLGEARKSNINSNVEYRIGNSSHMPFASSTVDLVTVSQAVHWFDINQFYKEVDRVLVPNGALAIYGYTLPQVCGEEHKMSDALNDTYRKLRPFWDESRELVDAGLSQLKPLYTDHKKNDFFHENTASISDVLGYVRSWSGYQLCIQANGESYGDQLISDLECRLRKEFKKDCLRFLFQFHLLVSMKAHQW